MYLVYQNAKIDVDRRHIGLPVVAQSTTECVKNAAISRKRIEEDKKKKKSPPQNDQSNQKF